MSVDLMAVAMVVEMVGTTAEERAASTVEWMAEHLAE